jgi:hypothetical protein
MPHKKEPEQLVFDGRIYNLWGTAPTKRLADAYADTRRNHGLLARVVKAKHEPGYAVYQRRK